MIDLTGQAIVVTGASRGIGAAIARGARAAGAEVFLTDRTAEVAKVADNLKGRSHVGDLEDPETPGEIIAAALLALGRIDGLVNAAGLTTRGSVTEATVEAWDQLMAVNARAPFFLMQGIVRHLRKRQMPGAIVNILSMNAHGGAPDLAAYSATKGALATLTRNAAHAHLRDRIRVNGINLGWTVTETEDRLQAETLGQGAGWAEAEGARRPMGRLMTAQDVVPLACFLLSEASVPMTGALIDHDQHVIGIVS